MSAIETHNVGNTRVAAINYDTTRKVEHDDRAQVDIFQRLGPKAFKTKFESWKEQYKMGKLVLENPRTELQSTGMMALSNAIVPTPTWGDRFTFDKQEQTKGGGTWERAKRGVTKESTSELIAPTPVSFCYLPNTITAESVPGMVPKTKNSYLGVDLLNYNQPRP